MRTIVTLIVASAACLACGCATGQARQGTVEVAPIVQAAVDAAIDASVVKMEAVVKTTVTKSSTNDSWTLRGLVAAVAVFGYVFGKSLWIMCEGVMGKIRGDRGRHRPSRET